MNKLQTCAAGLVLGSSLLASAVAQAETDYRHQVGLALYQQTISYDAVRTDTDVSLSEDLDFSGVAVFYTGALNENIAVRAGLYTADDDDDAATSDDATGLDLQLLFGINMNGQGFRAYAGPGYYSDKWESPSGGSKRFSSLQVTGGLGFVFDRFAVDGWVTLRLGDRYSDHISNALEAQILADEAATVEVNTDADATSAGVMLSYQF